MSVHDYMIIKVSNSGSEPGSKSNETVWYNQIKKNSCGWHMV